MTKAKSYKELRAELDELMAWFESGEVDVEQALEKFAEAEKLLKALEAYLEETELKIKKL